ncbi:MAG: hypothetical protein J5825_06810 [Lachnospiraceae bacterium]|nr:hypothetical protein [Lachnospiraceae bacterium]
MSRINKHCKRTMILATGLCTVFLGGCSLLSSGTEEQLEAREQDLYLKALDEDHSGNASLSVAEVSRGPFTQKLSFEATAIFPINESVSVAGDAEDALANLEAGSPEAADYESIRDGKLQKVVVQEILLPDYASYVEAGTPLFSYTLAAESDEVALTAARMELERAKTNYADYVQSSNEQFVRTQERIAKMEGGFARTKEELQYQQSVISYQEEVAKREKKISDLEKNLENIQNDRVCIVKAPISGQVSSLRIPDPGKELAVGDSVMIINSLEDILLRVDDKNGGLRVNQRVKVYAGEIGKSDSMDGTVVSAISSVSMDMKQSLGEYSYIRLDGDTSSITQSAIDALGNWWSRGNGQSFSVVSDYIEISDALLVDSRAVVFDQGRPYVMIAEDGKTRRMFFSSGGNNSTDYWVLDGLEEGTEVVLNPAGKQ